MTLLIVLMSETRVGAALLGRARRRSVMSLDVGRELDETGVVRDLLHPLGDLAGVLGHLADRRAHAALAHAVRAAEVQLEAVGAGVLGAA